MDYLKYEESHQIRYMKSLNEIKNKMMNEYKMIKNKEEINKNKIVIVSKEENELFNKNGFEDIKNHEFFKDFNFKVLLEKKMKTPYKPTIGGILDDNKKFEKIYTFEDLKKCEILTSN
jgi:hypothetical protein